MPEMIKTIFTTGFHFSHVSGSSQEVDMTIHKVLHFVAGECHLHKGIWQTLCMLCALGARFLSHPSRLTNVQSHLPGLTVRCWAHLSSWHLHRSWRGASVFIISVSRDHGKSFTNLPLESSISLPSRASLCALDLEQLPRCERLPACCCLSCMTKRPPQRGFLS